MKIVKVGAYFTLLSLISAVIAGFYFREHLVNTELLSLRFPKIFTEINQVNKRKPPLQKQQSTQNPEHLKQLLQQRYMATLEKETEFIGNSNDPDNKQMIEEAIRDLHSSTDPQDRELAVMTLGEYSIPKAKESILFALNDPEMIVREQAVIQISKWMDENERSKMLLIALKNSEPDIVVQALESIMETDNPELIKRIKQLSKNKHQDIRQSAIAALDMVAE